jgi:CRP-like cAMP-binding protein
MNELLNQLPEAEFALLMPYTKLVSLSTGDELYDIGEKINIIYFPITALISIAKVFPDGSSMDTANVGREGLVGVKALTQELSIHRIYVSSSGLTYKINCAEIDSEVFNKLAFYKILLLASTQINQKMSIEMLCSNYHSIESRLARWLIIRHDLEKSGTIKTTHQFIATSMGVRRESITNASAKLKGLKTKWHD